MLGIKYLWRKQVEIAEALLKPPYKVLVKAGHSLGKTFLSAWICNWWYDSFNPGVCVTTAPTDRDVKDLLWKEIRSQRQRAGLSADFRGDSGAEMRSSPNHYAKGFTADKFFQGRHDERMLFIFDEALGVDARFWESVRTMFKPEFGHGWLVIFNPTDTTSHAYMEEQRGNWNVFTLSSMEHPNIKAALDGRKPPIPAAVTKPQVDEWVKDWCDPVKPEEVQATDFAWEIEGIDVKLWRPGPQFESRCLGRWPSLDTYGVWSDSLWAAIERPGLQYSELDLPQIGCDVARYGDDYTEIHLRRGPESLLHEAHNGWSTTRTAGRLMQLANEMAAWINQERRQAGGRRPDIDPRADIVMRVDDDGVGGAVVDILRDAGYNVVPISAGSTPVDIGGYPNKRSELWFLTKEKALAGLVNISRLEAGIWVHLREQAMAPKWKLDTAGRRVVEPKEMTKKNIGRSPDGMDALNLAYYSHSGVGAPVVVQRERDEVGEEATPEPAPAGGGWGVVDQRGGYEHLGGWRRD